MAFTAKCPFCRIRLQNVPQERFGASTECPRCHNLFTLAPVIGAPTTARTKNAPHSSPIAAVAASMPLDAPAIMQSIAPLESAPPLPAAPLPMSPAKTAYSLPLPRSTETNPKPFPRAGRRSFLGVSAFCLGSMALLTASVPRLEMLALPASILGTVLGIAGLIAGSANRRGLAWPAAGLAVSLAVSLLVGFWPTMLGLAPRAGATSIPVKEQLTVVPIANRDGSAARPAVESEWTDVSQNVVHKSDLRLRVTSVTVMPLEYQDAKGKKVYTKEKYLQIELRLSNVGINHTIEYAGWGDAGPTGTDKQPRLRDNSGKPYAVKTRLTGTQAAGRIPRTTIGPLKAVKDVLVFEPPAAEIECLRLELPCSAFGAEGRFQLLIPKHLVSYQ
jgi:hypothetical protein